MNRTIIVYALATIAAAILLVSLYLMVTYIPGTVVLPIIAAGGVFVLIKALSFPIEHWIEDRYDRDK